MTDKKREASDRFIQERYRRGRQRFTPDLAEPIAISETARAEEELWDERPPSGSDE